MGHASKKHCILTSAPVGTGDHAEWKKLDIGDPEHEVGGILQAIIFLRVFFRVYTQVTGGKNKQINKKKKTQLCSGNSLFDPPDVLSTFCYPLGADL